VPAVVALRRHFERVRAEAALAAGGDVEAATRLLVNRLLHDPSEVLREMAGMAATDAAQMEDFLRRLFRLGDEEERE
jgi:glutamyl-tRNA reductase